MILKLLLVDDHQIVRDGLRLVLQREAEFVVVGEAEEGRDAVVKTKSLSPNVVVMDLNMPGLGGVEAIRQIRATSPETQVVVLSMYRAPEHVARALRAGALGYVLKHSAGTELVKAIRAVSAGRRYIELGVREDLLNQLLVAEREEELHPLARLSTREREVFYLVVEGLSSREIGVRLNLSAKTVDTYRSRLMTKLSVGDLASLVRFAARRGLIEDAS